MSHTSCLLNALLCSAALIGSSPDVSAQFGIRTTRVASGFNKPVFITSPPNDSRLFVVEKDGLIKVFPQDQQDAAPFLDLSAKVDTTGESGLLGLAFHPNYANNGKFFVCFTEDFLPGDPRLFVESYRISETNPNRANPASVRVVFGPVYQSSPGDINHGGCLAFDSKGFLYLSTGDGDNPLQGQNGLGFRSKMIRLDINIPYPHTPATNPFINSTTVRHAVWSQGLRSPWRFSFDRLTGDLFISECGADLVDEIDWESVNSVGGLNYGWSCMEGTTCTGIPGSVCECGAPVLTPPIEEIPLAGGTCAIVGGYVYRGDLIPALYGRYVYGDFCTGRIFSFTYDGVTKGPTVEHTAELNPPGPNRIESITSFGEDRFGELYICDFDGEIYKIAPCVPSQVVLNNGTGVNPVCFSSTSSPKIGTTWSMQVDATAIANAGKSYVRCRLGSASIFTPQGELLLDPASPMCFSSTVVGTGIMNHTYDIPNDPTLVGQTWFVQGSVGSAAGPLLQFCNALDVVVGCP
jgi:hypothetical protein